jgi:GTP-binding protein EngB required for normal cell division
MYFFDKPEKIESFNIYDIDKKKEYIKWEEDNIEYIKYDNILYNMFLEKKDKINMEFDDTNLNYNYNNRITPINLKLEDY